VVGLAYAAVSAYWGVGGTWLVDTVGGSLARLGRAGDPGVLAAVWAAAVLKATAAVLPLLAVRGLGAHRRTQAARSLAWIAAAILTVYGAVLTTVGLLLQLDVIHRSATADQRALAWHAYLWDPWFVVWGLLVATALLRSRGRDGATLRTPLPSFQE
jgi:hypothetical protein